MTAEEAKEKLLNDPDWGRTADFFVEEDLDLLLEYDSEDEGAFFFKKWVTPKGATIRDLTPEEYAAYGIYFVNKSGNGLGLYMIH